MDPLYAQTIDEFAHRLGLPALKPAGDGSVALNVEKVGRLFLDPFEGGALVTVARPWPHHAEKTASTAVALCHWRECHPWVVNAGIMTLDWISFTATLPMREFRLSVVEKVVDYLSVLLDRVEEAEQPWRK